jgi:hypothetical protein
MISIIFACVAENVRASSAAPKKVRSLGQLRNSEVKKKKRVRSAEATLASRSLVESEEKQAQQAFKPAEKQLDQVSVPEEKQVDQVSIPEEKQVDQVSIPEEKQVDQVSSELQEAQGEVDTLSKTEENDVNLGKLKWQLQATLCMSSFRCLISTQSQEIEIVFP